MIDISFIFLGAAYFFGFFFYSKYVGSLFNLLLPNFLTTFITIYLLEYVYFILNGSVSSPLSYFFNLLFPVVYIWVFFLAFVSTKKSHLVKEWSIRFPYLSLILVFIAYLVYSPILVEFKDYISDPRYIYENTRTGYGIFYYGSILIAYISVCISLIDKSQSNNTKLFVVALSGLLAYLHGSKGQLLTLIIIVYSYFVISRTISIKFYKKLFISCLLIFALPIVFYLMSRGLEVSDLPNHAIGYSSYIRNGASVLDKFQSFEYGRIFIEDNIYMRIPRVLWESKPINYGSFSFIESYFPDEFYLNQGAPSLGYSLLFVDFGVFSYIIVSICAYINGFIAAKIQKNPSMINPASFFLLIYIYGAVLIPTGFNYTFPEVLILYFFIRKFFIYAKKSFL